ncbi:MAG: 5-nucleotidase SurE [Devosia sp.]|nr:5-nucleotidase SurE [Devosia sp.]
MSLENPRILLVNDDGVDAPGMDVLRRIAAELSDDVWVVAPDSNQSGAGHRFSIARELSLTEREPQVFAIHGGSPADCVVVGITHLMKDQAPDLVLSGVNNGQNLGDIVHCSGTVAGAREAALHNILGIAISQAVDYVHRKEVIWDNSLQFTAGIVRTLIAEATGRDTYYNVNLPFCAPETITGIELVPHQRFSRSVFAYYPSDNPGKFFIAIPETPLPLDDASDFQTLHQRRAITITPLSLLQTDTATTERLQGKFTL